MTLKEIPLSLEVNPSYRHDLIVLAGDAASARLLEGFGLQVHRVFDDAPADIVRDAAHKMKHWMCRWALRTFGEFLWVDWDTVILRAPDSAFWSWCRHAGTPKFIHIPNYWATVNCGIYYAGKSWLAEMERSFSTGVAEPNDELLWTSVLPPDVCVRPQFWWEQRVVQVWNFDDCKKVTADSYFAHVKHLDWATALRAQVLRDTE